MRRLRHSLCSFALLAALVMGLMASASVQEVHAQEDAETFSVDKVHSSVLFRVKHANASFFFGRLIDVSGTIQYDRDNPSNSSVNLTVQTESVRTFSKKRDNHLRSPDFFNAKQYPTISFKSTSVKPVEGKENRFKVTGTFSLHGVTKELTIDVEKTGEGKGPEGNPRIGFYSTFTIDRTEFGMSKYADSGMIGKNVKLYISIEGVKK